MRQSAHGRRARELVLASGLVVGLGLLGTAACGGSPDGGGDRPAGETAAEAVSSDTTAPDEHTHGPETHTHGPGSEGHPAGDTLSAGVPLEAPGNGVSLGSATVVAVGDSLQVLLEIRGADGGARYAAELLAGGCSKPGEILSQLTPVMAGTTGRGTSQSSVGPGVYGEATHGAVRLFDPSGEVAACAPVHLSGSHTHESG